MEPEPVRYRQPPPIRWPTLRPNESYANAGSRSGASHAKAVMRRLRNENGPRRPHYIHPARTIPTTAAALHMKRQNYRCDVPEDEGSRVAP